MNLEEQYNLGRWLHSRTGLVLLAFLAIAGLFLVTELSAHIFDVLPYLLLYLCLLLHLIMHNGNRKYGEHSKAVVYVEISQLNTEGGKQ